MSSREQAVQQARKTVEQLRGERNMRRTPVSASAADLISVYISGVAYECTTWHDVWSTAGSAPAYYRWISIASSHHGRRCVRTTPRNIHTITGWLPDVPTQRFILRDSSVTNVADPIVMDGLAG
ncbi:hypothetical protein Y032_0005g2513 [Ancylostoma ceylanicum]|uniref:G protein gamma domain-containing protein n=1 Tax=Ancylostoma ceylanicum TaxID=53326 RepID=A0A016VTY2_9BILA|nr:hypothetical protein Y032_0005g2513 [Ancylostoma ceylanicum]